MNRYVCTFTCGSGESREGRVERFEASNIVEAHRLSRERLVELREQTGGAWKAGIVVPVVESVQVAA